MQQISRHSSGLLVATAEMPHMASVSLGFWVGVGGRHEPVDLCGISHFIEHILFKGTKKRTARQISQDVEGIGGYLNAFTGEETTCFYSKARHDRQRELFDVLTDMFLHSRFDPVEINKERSVIKEELAMYLDQPQHYVHELLNETLWPDQPLGRSLTGTPATLDFIERRALLNYQRGHYVSEGMIVAAAGNLRHDEIMEKVGRFASRIPAGKRPCFPPARNGQDKPRLRLHTKPVEQTQMALGIRACSRHDERRHALRLLNTMLGENMSSRLFQVLREDNGLAYSISSSLSLFDDAGALAISAGLESDTLTPSLRLIMKELARFRNRPPAAAELNRARDYLIGQMDMALESTENQMMWLGEQLLSYGKVIPPAEVRQHLADVTPRQIQAAARDFFRTDRLNLALVSPLDQAKEIERELAL